MTDKRLIQRESAEQLSDLDGLISLIAELIAVKMRVNGELK